MKSIIIPTALLSILSLNSIAQTDVDASRYSGSSITGTARYTALSGAFGTLGGDFTTLSHNPAGIAIYRSSEFSFSPSVYVGNTESNFQGQRFDENKFVFNIGNAGVVFTKKLSWDEMSPGWKSWNFGFGYNRLNSFHNRSYYIGLNKENSMLDNFAQNSSGLSPSQLDPFYESLAYNAYMTNPDFQNIYHGVIPNGQEIQQRSSENRGAMGETVFTFGGNYSNQLYLGATFGFKNIHYYETTTYEEFDPDSAIPNFNAFNFQQDMATHGSGFDFKMGMIFKPSDNFRFGLAAETPTWFSMHDDYKNSMTGVLDSGIIRTFPATSPDGFYDYDLTTPFKMMGSMAYIFDGKGLISADYEFEDQSDARFDAYGASFSEVNNLIRQKYEATHTVRLGGEWLYNNFSFRGGASFTTSPLSSVYQSGGADFAKKSFSGGVGFRDKNIFLDLGYVYTYSNEFYQPYTLVTEAVPGVKTKIVQSNFVLTFGVKF